MNRYKSYKQYFTPPKLADFMVEMIPENNITSVIDLSMGECGLLESAKKRWGNATFLGADIDETLLNEIHKRSPYIHTFACDSLDSAINNWHIYQNFLERSKFDLVVANPPFNYYDQKSIQVSSGKNITVPIEIRFLLKYIDITRDSGYISIILPYGFLSLDLYYDLRLYILSKVKILNVVKLFEKCFDNIDADTCLILMKKKSYENNDIQSHLDIVYLDENYKCYMNESIEINANCSRLDFEHYRLMNSFYALKKSDSLTQSKLSEVIVECKRGRTLTNRKDLISSKGIRFIHTTDVKFLQIDNKNPRFVSRCSKYFENAIVNPEDILLGRVGKACIGKVSIIPKSNNKAVISDCIFSIKVKNIDPYYLSLYLASAYGQIQLKAFSKGSCSKYITKEDLLNILILVADSTTQEYFREKYMEILSLRGRVNKRLYIDKLIIELENMLGKE